MKWLNYQHLFYFWNIVEYGGITKASKKLRLSQPTISAQIKSLEEQLGEKLFQRQGREIKLTEAGNIAFEYSDKIFSLGNELLEVLEGANPSIKTEFKVGISDVVSKKLAFKIIKPAFVSFENTKVSCFEDKSEKLLADLAVGSLDLIISDRQIPSNVKVKGYSHFLGQSDISFLGDKSLVKEFKKNFPKSISNAPLLIPSDESILHNKLLDWFDNLKIKPKIVGTFQDSALMKIAAKDKLGIMPIPKVIASDVCDDYGLEIIGSTSDIQEELYVISLERRLKNPIIIQICNLSSKVFR